MQAQRERIGELFLIALNLDVEDRQTFLDTVEPDCRGPVEELLVPYFGIRFPPPESGTWVYNFQKE